jgi:hypothetical protein
MFLIGRHLLVGFEVEEVPHLPAWGAAGDKYSFPRERERPTRRPASVAGNLTFKL